MDIYKVSFEMDYDLYNNQFFRDVLLVNIDGSVIGFNVYGTFIGETFRELVTGEEIPIPRRKLIPGFGAFQLSKVYLVDDYRDLTYYLKLANKYFDEYKRSFDAYRDELNKKRADFVTTYMDSYGKLSSYSEERENALNDELDSYIRKVQNVVNDLKDKEMNQDNLQLCLFRDEN